MASGKPRLLKPIRGSNPALHAAWDFLVHRTARVKYCPLYTRVDGFFSPNMTDDQLTSRASQGVVLILKISPTHS
jgi:hypothetical protein